MKRARKIPDWRYHPTPVLRDVPAGFLPLKIDVAGRILTVDFRVEIIEHLEAGARACGKSFPGFTSKLLARMITDKHREMFGF